MPTRLALPIGVARVAVFVGCDRKLEDVKGDEIKAIKNAQKSAPNPNA